MTSVSSIAAGTALGTAAIGMGIYTQTPMGFLAAAVGVVAVAVNVHTLLKSGNVTGGRDD